MKSLMQEASSVVKAIEKAWITAGKPKEFSVRVFEEAEHNFIGMTTKQAKVGIFFGERIVVQEAIQKNIKPKEHRFSKPEITPEKRVEKTPEVKRPIIKKEKEDVVKNHVEQNEKPHAAHVIWNAQMIEYAKKWLEDALSAMNNSADFQVSAQNYYLRFTFNKPVLELVEKERALFRSFSFLILQSLKKETRRPLRGFKVVLVRNNDA